jgi:hypothetical protein
MRSNGSIASMDFMDPGCHCLGGGAAFGDELGAERVVAVPLFETVLA